MQQRHQNEVEDKDREQSEGVEDEGFNHYVCSVSDTKDSAETHYERGLPDH